MIDTSINAFVCGERQLGRVVNIPPGHAAVVLAYTVHFERTKKHAEEELRRLVMPTAVAVSLLRSALAGQTDALIGLHDCLLEEGQPRPAEIVRACRDVIEWPHKVAPVQLELAFVRECQRPLIVHRDAIHPQQYYGWDAGVGGSIIVPPEQELTLTATGRGVWGSMEWQTEQIEVHFERPGLVLGELSRR